jgi:hypothetical protein
MSPEEIALVKDLSIMLGGVVALTSLLSGVGEFMRQGRQRRSENLVHMRRRFLETPKFAHILELLQTDSEELAGLPIQERRNFAAFFEEVALMVNSGMIRRDVAHYMFGYYTLLVSQSQTFWKGLHRDSAYWQLFNAFAEQMERMERDYKRRHALRY